MDSWFISDIHLKSQNERNGQILLRFFNSILNGERKADYIFLVGDIFDVWVSDHEVFVKNYSQIVDCIKTLVLKNVKVVYFEGNHDMHIDKFWKNLGVEVLVEPKHFDLDGTVVRVEHGDLINANDINYFRLKNFFRHPITEQFMHKLPGKFWKTVGDLMSHNSRKTSGEYRSKKENDIIAMIRSYAEIRYDEDLHFNLIVTGHMHVRDLYEFHRHENKITSVNLGSWFEEPAVLHVQNKKIELLNLS